MAVISDNLLRFLWIIDQSDQINFRTIFPTCGYNCGRKENQKGQGDRCQNLSHPLLKNATTSFPNILVLNGTPLACPLATNVTLRYVKRLAYYITGEWLKSGKNWNVLEPYPVLTTNAPNDQKEPVLDSGFTQVNPPCQVWTNMPSLYFQKNSSSMPWVAKSIHLLKDILLWLGYAL